MVLVRRLGVAVVIGAASYFVACSGHRRAIDAVLPAPHEDPAPKWENADSSSLARLEAERAAAATRATATATATVVSGTRGAPTSTWDVAAAPPTPLATFGSKEELTSYLRKAGMIQPSPKTGANGTDALNGQGNMWGDAIGDAFGAGGLGLSGVGEGGGGQGEGIGLGSIGTMGHGAGYGGHASTSAAVSGNVSVTNTQHVGVDEGGIVKVRGDHLVVLRRGRLFSVRTSDLTPVSAVDAFAPGLDPSGAWYDEMLVTNDTIVVVGYSYSRGGTEVGLFDIDAAGLITARSTHHLRSDDYYSSRNYASRLIGDKLVFYTPEHVRANDRAPLAWLPAVRRWRTGATAADFTTIIEPTAIYRSLTPPERTYGDLTLHTVTTCDLAKTRATGTMQCTARGVLGPTARVFYTSPTAVYVWMTAPRTVSGPSAAPASLLYRLPLDPSTEPRVLRTRGGPIDQFSFLERDGYLNVALRADAAGDAMWSPERSAGAMAIMRVPLASFSTRADAVPDSSYTLLPRPVGRTMQNRFVGDYLVYGAGRSWGPGSGSPEDTRVFMHRYGAGAPAMAITLDHGIDRIEPMGTDAIVIGSDGGNLGFSSIALETRVTPFLAGKYAQKGAGQGELRSHGFFFRNDGARKGIVGLPIRSGAAYGAEHLVRGSASVLYLESDGLRLRDLGALHADPPTGPRANDRCKASCVDWYGNARPLFIRDRVFALLGYEIVEGKMKGTAIETERRVSFAPR